jgi:hypothetical protein
MRILGGNFVTYYITAPRLKAEPAFYTWNHGTMIEVAYSP